MTTSEINYQHQINVLNTTHENTVIILQAEILQWQIKMEKIKGELIKNDTIDMDTFKQIMGS